MASESSDVASESSEAAPECDRHEHLRPEGTEPLARIAVDYTPDACRHAPESGEIHVTYDDRGGARWRSRGRFLPGGTVAAAVRAPAGDTEGLNYNLYLSSLEGSGDMDEIDFEFLGNDKRAVQTNFFVAGRGGREAFDELPFDSSDGFHHYAVAWDAEAIEWRVDGEVIRREERRDAEEPWPEKPMFLYASFWDASEVDEGRWIGTYHGRDAPYVCSYRDVRVPVSALSAEDEECQDDADAGDEADAAAATCGAPVEEERRMPELEKIRSWHCSVSDPCNEPCGMSRWIEPRLDSCFVQVESFVATGDLNGESPVREIGGGGGYWCGEIGGGGASKMFCPVCHSYCENDDNLQQTSQASL